MASVVNDPNGRKRILFIGADGERRPIRLGKVSVKQAEAFKVKVEQLVSARITGSMDDETARWLVGIDDSIHAKLAAVELVEPRQTMTLGGWLNSYLAGRACELKPRSLQKLQDTSDMMLAHFKPATVLRSITPQQASEWRQALEKRLSVASARIHSGNAKTMMSEAVRRRLIPDNPFAHLKSGATPSKYTRYITPDEIERIIEACPNAEWRLLFGLARLAGLRVPSESHLLTWADVDWERARLTVQSPKTERHHGHEQRIVPITPRLMELLQTRFDECPEGTEKLVTMRGGWITRQVRVIAKRAGVEMWDRLWQALRSSCEKEWAMTFPQYAVSKWIGHSITVSGRHYANDVPDELFDKAAQNQAQSQAVLSRTASLEQQATPIIPQETAPAGTCSQEKRVSDGIRTRDPKDHNSPHCISFVILKSLSAHILHSD